MTPDLYAAWLTAGHNLQPVGHWIAAHWPYFAIAVTALPFTWWAIRHDGQPTRDRAAAWRQLCDDPPKRETQPGSDSNDLHTCLQILRATDTARKEKP